MLQLTDEEDRGKPNPAKDPSNDYQQDDEEANNDFMQPMMMGYEESKIAPQITMVNKQQQQAATYQSMNNN